jgi:hypothetical protein
LTASKEKSKKLLVLSKEKGQNLSIESKGFVDKKQERA